MDTLSVRRGLTATGTTVLQVVGQLTAHTAGSFRRAVDDGVSDDGRCVVVDLTGVTFMDATGAVAVSQFRERVGLAGDDVSLVGPSRDVARLLQLCGVVTPARRPRQAARTPRTTAS